MVMFVWATEEQICVLSTHPTLARWIVVAVAAAVVRNASIHSFIHTLPPPTQEPGWLAGLGEHTNLYLLF